MRESDERNDRRRFEVLSTRDSRQSAILLCTFCRIFYFFGSFVFSFLSARQRSATTRSFSARRRKIRIRADTSIPCELIY